MSENNTAEHATGAPAEAAVRARSVSRVSDEAGSPLSPAPWSRATRKGALVILVTSRTFGSFEPLPP